MGCKNGYGVQDAKIQMNTRFFKRYHRLKAMPTILYLLLVWDLQMYNYA